MNGALEILYANHDFFRIPLQEFQWNVYFQIAFVSAGAFKIINASIGIYMMYINTTKSIRKVGNI